MPIPTPPPAAPPSPDYAAFGEDDHGVFATGRMRSTFVPPSPKVIVLRWDSIITAVTAFLLGVSAGIGLHVLILELVRP